MSNKEEVLRKIIEADCKLRLGNEDLIDKDKCSFTIDDLILSPINYGFTTITDEGKKETANAYMKYSLKDMFTFNIYYKNEKYDKYYLITELTQRINTLCLLSSDFNIVFYKLLDTRTLFQPKSISLLYPATILRMFNNTTIDDFTILFKDTIKDIIRQSFPTVKGVEEKKYDFFINKLANSSVYNEFEKVILINEKVVRSFLSIPEYYFNKHFNSINDFYGMIGLLSINNTTKYVSDRIEYADVVINKQEV